MMFTGWELPSALYVLASTKYWRYLLIEYVLSSLDKLIDGDIPKTGNESVLSVIHCISSQTC
jgi:hypothetical protein